MRSLTFPISISRWLTCLFILLACLCVGSTSQAQNMSYDWRLTFYRGEGNLSLLKKIEELKQKMPPPTDLQEQLDALKKQYQKSDVLVTLINSIAGSDTARRLPGGVLHLEGPVASVNKALMLLVETDTPFPQVQLDMWNIQITGTRGTVSKNAFEIRKQISEAQSGMRYAQFALGKYIQQHAEPATLANLPLLKHLHGKRATTIVESLIKLSVMDERQSPDFLKSLHDDIVQKFSTWVTKAKALWGQQFEPFSNIKATYSKETQQGDKLSIDDFAHAWQAYYQQAKNPEADFHNTVTHLRRASASADMLLKSGMDAFAKDMEQLFLYPLLNAVNEKTHAGNDVSMAGRTRLVVTSGLLTQLKPELEGFVDLTRPKPITSSILSSLLTNGNLPHTYTVENILKLMETAAALDVKTANVAPGIDISVQPTVFPNGTEARLQFDCVFGIDIGIHDLNSQRTLDQNNLATSRATSSPAISRIRSYKVKGDVAIAEMDLFDISSLSATASYPQPPKYIPILGQLPLIGPLFQFSRGKKVMQFDSIILTNAVILPRAKILAELYNYD